jgi:hypothetical protein
VRKGFRPVFGVQVTFERPADPIGTHMLTAPQPKAIAIPFSGLSSRFLMPKPRRPR